MRAIARILCAGLLLCGIIGLRAAQADTKLPIRIGIQTDNDWLTIEARDLHLFEKAGLAPTYLRFTAGAPMMAAAAGDSIDMAVPGTLPFLAGISHGIPWRAIGIDALGPQAVAVVVRTGSGIHTLADLKGKRVAFYPSSGGQYVLFKALAQAHLGPSDIHAMRMTPAEQVVAMRNNNIDAAAVWEPWIQELIHRADGRLLVRQAQLGTYIPDVAFYAVKDTWLAQHQETARRFLTAIVWAHAIIQQNPQPAIATFAAETGIDPSWAKTIYQESPPTDVLRWTDPSFAYALVPHGQLEHGLADISQFLLDQHVIEHPVDVSHLLDPSVIEWVLRNAPKSPP